MSTLRGTRVFVTGMPFSNMHFAPTRKQKQQHSNVSQICFGNKECIAKRDAANAAAAAELAQQQAVLMQALNQKSGGLSALAITGIVFGILTVTGTAIFLIHKHTI